MFKEYFPISAVRSGLTSLANYLRKEATDFLSKSTFSIKMKSPPQSTLATHRYESDAKLAHLDGLNLSRAWCWRVLKRELPPEFQPLADQAIARHLDASLPQAGGGHYVGSHWLASFAALALTEA